MQNLLLTWQTLIGAFIGASAPVAFWFFTKWTERRRERKNELLFMQKEIVFAINNVLDSRHTLKVFIDNNIQELKCKITEATEASAYCATTAYMPKFHIHEIDSRATEIHYISGYLENSIMRCRTLSKDFNEQIQDLRMQYESGYRDIKELAIHKVNSKEAHNQMYLQNIENFENVLVTIVIERNINTYLTILFKTLVTIKEIDRLGVSRWRFKFSPTFKFFKDSNSYLKYKETIFDKIEQLVTPLAEGELLQAEKKFNQ